MIKVAVLGRGWLTGSWLTAAHPVGHHEGSITAYTQGATAGGPYSKRKLPKGEGMLAQAKPDNVSVHVKWTEDRISSQ